MKRVIARTCATCTILAFAGSGLLYAGTLTPPDGAVAATGVTTQQIYDSVQGLATTNGDSGVRAPGASISQPATMTVAPSGLPEFTTPIFNATVQFTRPIDQATGQATGAVVFNGMTVTRDAGDKSGLFFNLMMTNRALTNVVLRLSAATPATYSMTNARVNSYRLLMTQRPGGSYSEVEEIGLNFGGSLTISDGTDSGVFTRSPP